MRGLGIDIGGTSVKACMLDGEYTLTARSDVYDRPTRENLIHAMRQAVEQLDVQHIANVPVGLCLPGKRCASGDSIEVSINLPCLNGWRFDELLNEAIGHKPRSYSVLSDVQAAGEDYVCAHKCSGRTAIIAIGTGVGLCVFDDDQPIGLGERSIGHLGMMDMGRLGQMDIVSPDASKNTLEAYVGARAIERRFPELEPAQLPDAIGTLGMDEPIMQAMVRAIRTVHAIYVPDQIVLMGGVGIAMQSLQTDLDAAIRDGLTSLARPNWELLFGDCAFHAARGAARSALS